jgi:hypothetical protein
MKLLYILLFLLAGLKPAISDSTLIFKSFSDKSSRSNSYYLQNNKLRLLEEHSALFNIYDATRQTFSSLDSRTGQFSRIDTNILNQRVKAMNKLRLKKLAELEKQLKLKLKDMSDKEKEAGESLLNQLKYPEMYGAHTLIKISKSNQSKTINNINCDIYRVFRKDKEIKQVCIADNRALKLNLDDYNTLRHFQQFNYMTQTQLMLAVGNTNFSLVDYQQENIDGIPIEIINTSGKENKLEMMLLSVSRHKLDKAFFLPTKQ